MKVFLWWLLSLLHAVGSTIPMPASSLDGRNDSTINPPVSSSSSSSSSLFWYHYNHKTTSTEEKETDLESSFFTNGILSFPKNTTEPKTLILFASRRNSDHTVWFQTDLDSRRILGLEAKDNKELLWAKDVRDAENHDGSGGIALSLFMPYFCADEDVCSAYVKDDGNCSLRNGDGYNTISYLLGQATYNQSLPISFDDEVVTSTEQILDLERYTHYTLDSFLFQMELICVGDDNERFDMIHLSAGYNTPLGSSGKVPRPALQSLTLTDFMKDAMENFPETNSRCGPMENSASNHTKEVMAQAAATLFENSQCVKPHTNTSVLYSILETTSSNSKGNATYLRQEQIHVTPDDTSIYIRGNVAGWLEVVADMTPDVEATDNRKKKTRLEFRMPPGRWLKQGTYHVLNNTAPNHISHHDCRTEYHLEIRNLPPQVSVPDTSIVDTRFKSEKSAGDSIFLSRLSHHLFNGTLIINHVEFDKYTGDIQELDMSVRLLFLNASSSSPIEEIERHSSDDKQSAPSSDVWLTWAADVKFRMPREDDSSGNIDTLEGRRRPQQATWDLQKTQSFVVMQQTPSEIRRSFVHTYDNDRMASYQHWKGDDGICCVTLLLGGSIPFTNITFCSNLYLHDTNSLKYGYEILWASDMVRHIQHETTVLYVDGRNVSMDHRSWEFRLYQLDYDDVDGTITEFSADLLYANGNSSSTTTSRTAADSDNDFTLVWARIHPLYRPNVPLTTMRISDERFDSELPIMTCVAWTDMFLYRSDWNPLWMGNIQHPLGYRNADSSEWDFWDVRTREPYPRYYGYDGARYVHRPENFLRHGGRSDSESDIQAGENGLAWIVSAVGTALVARFLFGRRAPSTSSSSYQHVRRTFATSSADGRRGGLSRRGVVVDADGWNAGLELTELT